MAKLSGILRDPAEQPIPNCIIEFKALKHSLNVVKTTTAGINVNNSGFYSVNLGPNEYQVKLSISGYPSTYVGNIIIYTDSPDGTLNSFLIAPGQSDLTPEIVKIFQDLSEQASESAESAKKSCERVIEDKAIVEALKRAVEESEVNVQYLNSNIEQIKLDILAAKDLIEKYESLTSGHAEQVLSDKEVVTELANRVVEVNEIVQDLKEQSEKNFIESAKLRDEVKILHDESTAYCEKAENIINSSDVGSLNEKIMSQEKIVSKLTDDLNDVFEKLAQLEHAKAVAQLAEINPVDKLIVWHIPAVYQDIYIVGE